MESVNWVCEEALEGHEWVSELTISMQEEEVLVALNYGIDAPCVVQLGLLWFSAPSRQNRRLERNGAKNAKYHEVTNLAFAANTPRACVLRSVAAVLDRAQDKDLDVGREMTGCRLREAHQIGWNESAKTSRVWVEKMMMTVLKQIKDVLQSNPPMGGAVTLAAEWFSHGEMFKLQGVSVLMSITLWEWQYKDTLDEIEDRCVGQLGPRVGRAHG